jgi:predicted DsbA family dithiol-disulfide isomerase
MRIEVWSDVVCPWCYIGKRHLETALDSFEHADEVEVVYRSFELDPSAPEVPVETTVESLARKFGTDVAGARELMTRADGVAASVGLEFNHADAPHARTVTAHRLLHLAAKQGRQGELKEALLAAYFVRGENVGDHDVLRKVAVDAGLDAGRVDEVLGSEEYLDEVHTDIAQARAYGATGVPFFVVDERYGVSGAQPTEVFSQLLDRAWAESHPAIELVGAGDADACGPDGCPI